MSGKCSICGLTFKRIATHKPHCMYKKDTKKAARKEAKDAKLNVKGGGSDKGNDGKGAESPYVQQVQLQQSQQQPQQQSLSQYDDVYV